ncbi:MAG: hypothetical protein ACREAF_04850 [Nitrosopumilaceae archaeon]
MESQKEPPKLSSSINYYVIAVIFVAILAYSVGNAIEPNIDSQLDFFEAALMLGFAAASIFAFVIAKRYWGSQVFGRAYLSLALGYAAYFIGWLLWFIYEIFYQVENPYPYWPDLGYFAFYPFSIYHLRTNIHYFKRKLNTSQKIIIFGIPVGVTIVYAFFGLVPIEAPEGIATLTIQPIPEYDQLFYKEYFAGLAFMFATTLVFSYAVVGAQVFRGTVLGNAWGLLLVGFALNTFADVRYYFFELFGIFDRADISTGLWMAGTLIVCYALYKHREI